MTSITFKTLNAGTAPAFEAASAAVEQARGFLTRAVYTLEEWHERARQRRRLMELDDRLLKDVGLTRADVARETSKPFWDV